MVAGDLLQYLRTGCEHRNLWSDDTGERLRPLRIDEKRVQLITARNRPFDDKIALGDKEPGHVAVWSLSDLPHDVISKSLELKDSSIVRIGYLDPVWV